ncbi:MAG: spermidine synthase [Akkermansiaceae bacterium]
MSGRFILALFLVTLTGYISLSYEILWVRLYSFASGAKAWAFGALLGTYLIGLALGSLWSLRFQASGKGHEELRALSGFVGLANGLGFLVIPIVSWLVVFIHFGWTFPIVVVAAAFLGAALPLICHFAIPPDEKAGARLSYLYLGNILGAGAGSLVTGFVLMDHFSIGQISVFLATLGFLLVLGLDYFSGKRGRVLAIRAGGLVCGIIVVMLAGSFLFKGLYERLQFKKDYEWGTEFKMVVESRFGVITIDEKDRIYGGGMYDGSLSVDMEPGSWMVRPYFLSAVHPAPKKVLEIGLSGGTWTQILAHNPHVEEITVVEINGAYRDRVIPQVEATRGILTNPKVTIVTDDGRRWLRRNPERKFDAIVLNMTHHWREHATNLLSKEFMGLVKERLEPGGIFLFNATGSYRVERTATQVFPDAILLLNNVVASNDKLTFSKDRWRKTLQAYEYDGVPLFGDDEQDQIDEIVSMLDHIGDRDAPTSRRIFTREQMIKDSEGKDIVTDDNLGHEFE